MQTHSDSFVWLRRLRWCAILGQVLTLLLASAWLEVPLQTGPLFLTLLTILVSNIALEFLPQRLQQQRGTIAIILFADVILLTLLLASSGGAENPFSILYLVQVVLAALLLDRAVALFVALTAIVSFGLLQISPWQHLEKLHIEHGIHAMHSTHATPLNADLTQAGHLNIHLLGMWVAFSIVALISAYCITEISQELRRSEREAERLRASQQQLASLTTLAAGAAHELSTPLGTIALVAGELEHHFRGSSLMERCRDDFDLMKSQIERCSRILRDMSGRSAELFSEEPWPRDPLEFAKELRSLAQSQLGIDVELIEDSSLLTQSFSPSLPWKAIENSVLSLLKNAAEASKPLSKSTPQNQIQITIARIEGALKIGVLDSGVGIPPEHLQQIGHPFFSSKPKGMGLGVFLARLTAERLGGRLDITSQVGSGTQAILSYPLHTIHLENPIRLARYGNT